MSWLNGNALAVMLRPMFPSIFAKVDELEADGTIDKTSDLLRTLSTNGTFDALKELAVKIDRHNELLERIADAQIRSGLIPSPDGGTKEISPYFDIVGPIGGPKPGPGPADGDAGNIHGAGVSGPDGPD